MKKIWMRDGLCGAALLAVWLLAGCGMQGTAVQPGQEQTVQEDPVQIQQTEESSAQSRQTPVQAAAEPTELVVPAREEDFDAWMEYFHANADALTPETIAAVQAFSWQTASHLLKDTEENGNYSPISLYYALSLASMGAEGRTKEEFLQLLHAEDSEALADQCGKLYRSLYQDGSVKADGTSGRLTIADSLWMQQGMAFEDSFLKTAAEDFYSSLYLVDFAAPETSRAMGKWIQEHTGGLIAPELEVQPRQVLSILNTIYFYDEWVSRFDAAQTKEQPFYLTADGTGVTQNLKFMEKQSQGSFVKGNHYTRAELGLKQGGSMVFMLPDQGTDVNELVSSEALLEEAVCGGEEHYGEIIWQVPKFSFGQSYDLVEAMEELGLSEAFTERADFSAMTKDAVWIDTIRQETHIGIDENGVEAAAYTEIGYCGDGAPSEKAEMILNRPFLYAILSRERVPLFIGVYRGRDGE